MAKRQRTIFKKEHLQKLGLVGKINENNEFELWKGDKKLNVYDNTTKHEVSGRHTTYKMYLIYVSEDNALNTGTRVIRNEYISLLQHVASYLWFKGDIPHELDVDHIDNDKVNNHPDNLQLLTRAENLRKNGIGRNQYSWNLTEEEIMEKRRLKEEEGYERQYRKYLRVTKNFYKDMYKNTIADIRDEMRDITSKLDSCTHQEYLRYMGILKGLRQKKKVAKEYYNEQLEELEKNRLDKEAIIKYYSKGN